MTVFLISDSKKNVHIFTDYLQASDVKIFGIVK
jgi:hypothetical protein